MTPEEKARKEAADARREQVGLSQKEEDGEGKKSTLITRKRKNKKDEPKENVEVVEELKPAALESEDDKEDEKEKTVVKHVKVEEE